MRGATRNRQMGRGSCVATLTICTSTRKRHWATRAVFAFRRWDSRQTQTQQRGIACGVTSRGSMRTKTITQLSFMLTPQLGCCCPGVCHISAPFLNRVCQAFRIVSCAGNAQSPAQKHAVLQRALRRSPAVVNFHKAHAPPRCVCLAEGNGRDTIACVCLDVAPFSVPDWYIST